jgi:hypothetical protein
VHGVGKMIRVSHLDTIAHSFGVLEDPSLATVLMHRRCSGLLFMKMITRSMSLASLFVVDHSSRIYQMVSVRGLCSRLTVLEVLQLLGRFLMHGHRHNSIILNSTAAVSSCLHIIIQAYTFARA